MSDPTSPHELKQASMIQVASAVFWSFFGVRKGKHMQQDAVTMKPLQVIIVGVVLAVVLVFALLALVRFITRAFASRANSRAGARLRWPA